MRQLWASGILVAILLLVAPASSWARGGGHSGGSHGGSVHVHGYFRSNGTYVAPYTRSAPHSHSSPSYSPPSYAVLPSPSSSHSTAVPWVERDSHGRIKRSSAARMHFLKSHGLTHTPAGCQVDHVVPLAKGGADDPSNMQLLCGEELHAKERMELK